MEYVRIGERKFGGLSSTFLDPAPYLERLPSMRKEFPPGAWQFAANPTPYDFYSPRCVKDLRPGRVEVSRRDEGRLARIEFLPSPFKHDAPLAICYVDVHSFEVAFSSAD